MDFAEQVSAAAISLLEHFKQVIRYHHDAQVEKKLTERLDLFRKIFNIISFHLLADRLKTAFENLLNPLLYALPTGSDERKFARRIKTTLHTSFSKMVDFTLPVVKQLYTEKKQDLLSDIYTMIVDSVVSKMLEERLMPLHKYRKIYVLREMHRRASAGDVPSLWNRSIDHRSRNHREKLSVLYTIYCEVAGDFTMQVQDLLQRLIYKRERNASKHYNHKINGYVTRENNRQLASFLTETNLNTMFDSGEVSTVQPIYEKYTHSVTLKWHEK
jgi:ribosomal protein S17E